MADRRLQVFHAVAKHLSFTRAADTLFMSQPAVTFQVRQLEEQYNARLFERRHGGITLTPAGDLALSYAERILVLSDEMDTRLAEISGEMRGLLLLGASTTIAENLLPGVLVEFNASHPLARPRLIVANSEAIASRVADHSLEVGLIDAPVKLPGLTCEVCCDDELTVICAPGYPLAKLKKVGPRALADYEYLSREPGSGTREIVENYFRACKVTVDDLKTQMELGSQEALKAVVATGLGFAIVSRATVEKELRLGRRLAPPPDPPLRRNIYLIQSEERFRSRLVTTFVQFARQRLKDHLA